MPSIAQQDYIVIDWEGNNVDSITPERLAEIRNQLRIMYEANPLTLFSVVMVHYDDASNQASKVVSIGDHTIRFFMEPDSDTVNLNISQ